MGVLNGAARWVGILFFLLTEALGAGEVTPVASVGRGPGVLAVQASGQEGWQIAQEGDTLPAVCSLRTAAGGPCLIRFPGGRLVVGPDTRLAQAADKRLVSLGSGRVFLETEEGQEWSIEFGGRRLTVSSDSATQVIFHGDASGVCVVRGSATVAGDNEPGQELGGRCVDWSHDKGERSRELSADEQERIRNWADLGVSPQGLGQLLVKDSQSGSTKRLNIARYHVNVVLQPPVALVQIDQSFYNPYDRQEEGTFVFNLPHGASVSRFAMYVAPDKLVEGELVERDRARRIYQTIVDRRRDPAILEQIGDNLFRMRVFPIFGKDTKRVLLDYTLPLKSQDGEYRFQLPLLSDLEPIWDFRLKGVVRGPAQDSSLASFSHPEMNFQRRDDGSWAFNLEKRSYQPEADFRLSFRERDEAEVQLRSQLAPPLPLMNEDWPDPWSGRSTTYFMASIRPDREAKSAPGKPADVLILADTSSGMRGVQLVRESVQTIVHNLGADDRFRLMAVDVGARPMHDGWLEAQEEQGESVLARFDREFCLGGTDLPASFTEAAKTFPKRTDARRRIVIYVGDGEDGAMASLSSGSTADDLAARLVEARATFVGVVARRSMDGYAILDRLARQSGGLLFDLAGGGGGNRDLFRWLLAGLPDPEKIEAVDVDGAAADDLLFPSAWLPGERFDLLGRVPWTDEVRLRITTRREGRKVERRWKLKADNDSDGIFVGRLWAQQKLDRLRCRESTQPGGEPVRDRILSLSQEWSLLTPHTAFLVLETELDYERWGVDRRARRRYWKPADAMPRAPLPADWLTRVTPDEAQHRREIATKRVGKAIEAARAALAMGDYSLAHSLLNRLRDTDVAKESEEFARLLGDARVGVQRESLRESLGPHRGLFDPGERRAWMTLEPRLMPLLTGALGAGTEFLQRHPHSRELLVDFPVQTRQGEFDGFNLQELADTIADVTGTNVVLDLQALEDVSMSGEEELDVYGVGQMSLRNYVRFVLSQAGLVMIEEPNRILITTEEEAEVRQTTKVYPVADLYLKERPPQLDLLANPYLDRDDLAEARIWSKLSRPISVDFRETPLSKVVDHLAGVLDDTVLVDQRALEDVNISLSRPVTARWKNVPAGQALEWILDQTGFLVYYVDEEALVISTREEKELRLAMRLHSGRDILYEYPVPAGLDMERFMGRINDVYGMGGGGTGMAGFMGGSGGLGGGLGGFGSAMGAMGAVGGMAAGAANFGEVVLGVDPQNAESESAEGKEEPAEQVGLPVEEAAAAKVADQQYVIETEGVTSQIVSTIDPISWEDVGGPGTVSFFPPTLDFVILQTDDVHQRIDALFKRLREMPAVWSKDEMRPAGIESVDRGSLWSMDFDNLIGVVASVVYPESWEDVGGANSIAPDLARLALVVSADPETHDRLLRLMTMLRRSRYQALRGEKPWERGVAAFGGAAAGGKVLSGLSVDLEIGDLPEPEPEEMVALQVRREQKQGRSRWRYITPAAGGTEETFEVRLCDGRMEIVREGAVFRVIDNAAAVAYPDLLLVEQGTWGEAVRQLADVWLPWMPTRSNRELARWFQVERLKREDEKGSDLVFLQLRPQVDLGDTETRMEIAFSRRDGLPRSWELYESGKLTGRLRFILSGKQDAIEKVILEDPSGEDLARWELISRDSQCPTIPDLTGGWKGYVQLDRRKERTTANQALAESLAAMHRFEWDRALVSLGVVAEGHPQHPLVLLLQAWCFEHRPNFNSRDEIMTALREVAAGPAVRLTRFIDRRNFPGLGASQLLEILNCQPESTRTAADLDRLTRVAIEANWPQLALEFCTAALTLGGSDEQRSERTRLRVELLGSLGHTDAALEAAEGWRKSGSRSPEQLAAMGEVLAKLGRTAEADGFFSEALGDDRLQAASRYGLLVRQANLHVGVQRWQALLEAASIQRQGSTKRRQCMDTVLMELDRSAHAKVAGMLAGETKDAELQLELRLRQAELTATPQEAAEIMWGIYKSGRLPERRLAWACQIWNRAGYPAYVIEAAEARLRAGERLNDDTRSELAAAYRSADRIGDARRAATSDGEEASAGSR